VLKILRWVLSLGQNGHSIANPWEEEIVRRSLELDKKYLKSNLYPEDLGVWTDKHLNKLDLRNFRSDNVYVWQKRNLASESYLVSYLLTKLMDKADLLESIEESGEYGAQVYTFFDKKISRDLIDSVLEINFLIDMVGIDTLKRFKVLDIGAGYGRLAKNLAGLFPELEIGCVDSIPMSTAISEFYLKEEIEKAQVKVYNLTQLEELSERNFDLATNVHSFSEMSLGSVEIWIKFLRKSKIPRVFVVPNPKELRLNTGEDFEVIFERYGYKVVASRSKFREGIPEDCLLYQANYFYLELE